MSYITLNPFTNIKPFVEKKSLSSYPVSLLKDIKMLTFFPKGLATPFGSYIYRIQKYPADVDLIEEFNEYDTVEQVINKFIINLKRVVKDILLSKLHYFSEFKCGLDNRYNIDIGNCKDGVYDINPQLLDISKDLYNNGLLDDHELNKISKIYNHNINNGDGYDVIFNIFRNRRILRWSANEILTELKYVNNKKFTLFGALHDKTDVKIDVLLLYNNKFIEMTNYVLLEVGDREHWININPDLQYNLNKVLPIEIEKLYFSNYYYSPFKMVKRMYSLARTNRNIEELNKIIPVISSNISLLYQLKGEIDVILLILEKVYNPPIITILKQLDNMKTSLVNILQFNNDEINDIVDLINYCLKTKNIPNIQASLKYLNDIHFKPKINFLTISYLETVELNPPPYFMLPKDRIYAYKRRSAYENPKLII